MVLFPEGGFLRKRREVSQRYAEKNNFPHLNHVSLPRIGALNAIFDILPTRSSLPGSNGNNNTASPTKRMENGGVKMIANQGMFVCSMLICSYLTMTFINISNSRSNIRVSE